MDEAAAARLFAAMARLADSGQDSAPAADLAALMANLAVEYPPEVHPCVSPAACLSCFTCKRAPARLQHSLQCNPVKTEHHPQRELPS